MTPGEVTTAFSTGANRWKVHFTKRKAAVIMIIITHSHELCGAICIRAANVFFCKSYRLLCTKTLTQANGRVGSHSCSHYTNHNTSKQQWGQQLTDQNYNLLQESHSCTQHVKKHREMCGCVATATGYSPQSTADLQIMHLWANLRQ